MSTVIRSDISKKNKYYIPKYRFLELKYFCLQYPMWKSEYAMLLSFSSNSNGGEIKKQIEFNDPTGDVAIRLMNLKSKISRVEKIAKMSDNELSDYILKAVTENLSFVTLKTVYEIPCERDMYYDRYRKFFWILDKAYG